MRLAYSRIEREPGGGAKLIFQIEGRKRPRKIFGVAKRRRSAAVVEQQIEQLRVLLGETVETRAGVISTLNIGEGGLAPFIFGRVGLRCSRGRIVRTADVIGAIEMVERRDGENEAGGEGANPGKGQEGIPFPVGIAKKFAEGIIGIGRIEGNLIVIAAQGSDEAQLILRAGVIDERSESAEAIGAVVNHRGSRRLQAEVGAVSVGAGVVSEAVVVAAEINLVVRLIEIAEAEDDFGFVVSLESRAGRDVEHAVSAVAEIGAVAAALYFKSVDVLGVDLGAEIASDVGVRDGHAVDEPTDLMTSAHVKLVMGEVGAGNVVGNHGEAVAAGRPGSLANFLAVNNVGGCDRFPLRRARISGNGDGLILGGELEFEVENRRGSREDDQGLFLGGKIRLRNAYRVFAERNGVEMKVAIHIGLRGLRVAGVFGF